MGDETVIQDLTGVAVGRYSIHERLGKGGMGEVYRAHDPRLRKDVALKRLNPALQNNPIFRERFEREAQLGATLNHPCVAGVIDVLEDKNGLYLLMEYVDGVTLRDAMQKPISLDSFLKIGLQCAEALVAAHARNIIHRDIKPENIMLTPAGQVKVCDFGVAKMIPSADSTEDRETNTATGSFIGTPAYTAPEIITGKPADHRVDLFSLGVVFYEMLTHQNPFRSESLKSTNHRIVTETPLPVRKFNAAVPRRIERIVQTMLEKDPDNRYQSAAELSKDLSRAVVSRKHEKLYLAGAVVGLLLAVTIALFTFQKAFFDWLPAALNSSGVVTSLPERRNLVVLPFRVVGGTSDNHIYSEGLVEILTSKLTQMSLSPNLQVIGGRDVHEREVDSADEARQEFGANLVLAGGFEFRTDSVIVTYSLVETSSLRALRTGAVTASLGDPFVLQDRVINAVLKALEVQLRNRTASAGTPMTHSDGALDAYVRGVGYLNRITDQVENIDNAAASFKQAIDKDPDFAEAHAGMGQAYLEKFDKTRQAEFTAMAYRHCAESMRLNPNLADAHLCAGSLASITGEYEKAVLEFERVIDIEPTNDKAYRGLGSAQQKRGRTEEAEDAYRRLVAARPSYAEAYSWLGGFYLAQNRHNDAIAQFRHALTLAPGNGAIQVNLGLVYANIGQFDDAIVILQKAATLRPTYSTFNNLGLTFMRARRLPEAIPVLEVAARLAQDYRTTGNLARAYFWTSGMRDKAPAMYERAAREAEAELQIDPRNADVHILLGRYYAMLSRRSQAVNHIEYALSIRPANTHYLAIAAGAYNQLGEPLTALTMLERAAEHGLTRKEIEMEYEIQSLATQSRFRALKQVDQRTGGHE